ncbi:fluoride efflux transporter CrcB [Rhodococcus triatomae]|uniref:Fluoride-specific ion channel FluC n=1 Tax=Rhodococcus triatomae TaxID=300028 RepID=A0A1G8PKZ3_9NOCA|nr:fluoride efflux transporter CrcB [Rhodococcus triatomae]QNG20137.1 fluoride efflux transporter CrcB [Rhodococcus triatomae]QNG23947.1 fluoride efflux transporter CrcB [Rhodococcus triatomae]SDI93211.1 CrcB protein [Rhodococcus triatomae]
MIALWVALAGSLGAVARFVVDGVVRSRWAGAFPWGTVVVNVSGSLLLGIATGLVLFHGAPSEVTLVVGVGFCGGYTTFSTASLESVRLIANRQFTVALAATLGTMLVTTAAAALGLAVTAL